MALRPDRFCNYIYYWTVQRLAPEDRKEFDATLANPLPGAKVKQTPASVAQEADDFMSAMMALG